MADVTLDCGLIALAQLDLRIFTKCCMCGERPFVIGYSAQHATGGVTSCIITAASRSTLVHPLNAILTPRGRTFRWLIITAFGTRRRVTDGPYYVLKGRGLAILGV